MIEAIGIGLMLLACYLLLKLFFNTCKVGVLGAIIGAIVCIFVPYKLETCAIWGFCIGMVFQFITDWEMMLVELVCAAVGFGVAVAVFYILKFCGAPYEYCSGISILIWIGFWCFGSSEAAEEIADSFDFSSGHGSGTYVYTEPVDEGSDPDDGRFTEWQDPNDSTWCCLTCKFYEKNFRCDLHSDIVNEDDCCDDYQWYRS